MADPALGWPTALKAVSASFNLRGQVIAGPSALTGGAQIVEIDSGFWVASIPAVRLTGADLKALRALRARHRGGAVAIRVPAFDGGLAPWPAGVDGSYAPTHSDGATFDDGATYGQGAIAVTLSAAAAAGDRTISVTVTDAGAIVGGEYFSLGDRLHQIDRVVSAAGGAQVWGITPGLRAAWPAGTALDFDDPGCRMRIVSEADMDILVGRRWISEPTAMALIEAEL